MSSQKHDGDHDGVLTPTEFFRSLSEVLPTSPTNTAPTLSTAVQQKLVQAFDVQHSGTVDFHAFVGTFRSHYVGVCLAAA